MTRTARLVLLGVFAVGCFAPKITLVDSFPDDGTSGRGGASGSAGAGHAGKTSSNGGGLPMSGNSSVIEAGIGGVDETAGMMNVSGSSGAGAAGFPSGGSEVTPAGGGGAGGAGAGGAGAGAPAGGAPAGGAPAGGSGGAPPDPITKAVKTAGCGSDPGQATGTAVKGQVVTMGTKPANALDSARGPWTYTRDYYVTLPTGYDNTKAYPLVIEGPGCGGDGTQIYPINDPTSVPNATNTVIRVGWTPPPNAIGHSVNPGQLCFDDKDGDTSVDFVFYTTLYDKLAGQLCFDRNRVFVGGNSSGSFLADELSCKFAGDVTRPIRGVLANTGGLPSSPYGPSCGTKPLAGMWVHEINDSTNPFSGTKAAIDRAMIVNGCSATSYDTATFENFPIGGGNLDTVCQKIKNCPDLYPLVVCALPGNAHSSHDAVVNPGWTTYLKLFETAPLLNP